MLPAPGASHAAGAEPLLRPTPLVLKDGRIANVSIHVLPFASGKAELAAEPAEYLAKLTRAVGTDCFLTAQVIGHIASNEIAGDDTLNAHRLARSRADAVQASLIGGGLPAKAIASVWDWQFMVREPRATLWVFELTAGEDCEGRQLHGDLVAEAPSAEQGKAAPERVTRPAAAPAEPPAASAAQPAGSPAKPAVTAAEPAVTAAKPAATAGGGAASQVARPSQAPAAQPPVVAHVEAGPPAAESGAARSQPEPGTTRKGAAKLAGAAPAAEPQMAATAQPAEQTATAEPPTRVPGQAAERPATGQPSTSAPAQPAEQAAGAEAQIAATAPSTKQPTAAEPKSAAPAQVAAVEPKSTAPAQLAEQPATAKAQTAAPASAAEQRATAEPKSAAPAQVAEQPATAEPKSTAPTQVAEQPVTAEPQTVARAEPAEQAGIAAAPAATPQSPAKPSTDDGKVESGPQGGLVITFATNSSYFPSGAAARLRELLAGVNGDKKYQVTLQVAVSGTTQVVGAKSADEAARYNKWLADRRVERVQAWLAKNAGVQALSIQPEYVANDDSRRLTVRVAPTG
jgi:hypothetical protein